VNCTEGPTVGKRENGTVGAHAPSRADERAPRERFSVQVMTLPGIANMLPVN